MASLRTTTSSPVSSYQQKRSWSCIAPSELTKLTTQPPLLQPLAVSLAPPFSYLPLALGPTCLGQEEGSREERREGWAWHGDGG